MLFCFLLATCGMLFFFISFCRLIFFFFSSRRRHTRCLSDWSSDVCSSDLDHLLMPALDRALALAQVDHVAVMVAQDLNLNVTRILHQLLDIHFAIAEGPRSEERRVGKECRSRWSREHEKTNNEDRDALSNK